MTGYKEVKESGTVVANSHSIARETSELVYIWDIERARNSERESKQGYCETEIKSMRHMLYTHTTV